MSVQVPHIEAEHRIELPADVVGAIADQLDERAEPTVGDARDLAFEVVDRQTEFVTEDGEALVDALQADGTGE